jgi:hypothetical protein
MTSPKRSGRIAYFLVVGTLAVLSTNGLAEKANQTRTPGKQFMVARYTSTPPVIDGVFSPAEWQGAVPVHVNGNTPATAPGVVPSIGLPNLFPPDSPSDSSFAVYTLYDDNNLYLAVDVTDDVVICDGPVPFLDDDAEIMIDGDRQPGDAHMALVCGPNNPNCPNPVVNNEGFKLTTSVCNQSLTDPSNNPNIVWESKAGRHPHGFVVEFRIPLDSINSIDTSWFSNFFPGFGLRRPQAGDTIGFNAAVGDDDNGGLSYVRSEFAAHTDSFTAWDGRSVGWYVFAERDWGNLYMAPPTH